MAVLAADPLSWPDVVTALTGSVAVVVAVVVAIVEAARAHRARSDRDRIEDERKSAERRSVARLITAWIERSYIPNEDGTQYNERVLAKISNESDVAVFNCSAAISLEPFIPESGSVVVLGPLSIPDPIPVLPPRRELTFDLSIPLAAYRQDELGATPDVPRIALSFVDQNDVHWVREPHGELEEIVSGTGPVFIPTPDDEVDSYLGRIDVTNPMAVVMAFLAGVTGEDLDEDEAFELVSATLAPEAEGWKNFTPLHLVEIRKELKDFGVGSHVMYPTPHVAYVKILDQETTQIVAKRGANTVIPVRMVTLIYHPDRGWRIFAYGGGGTSPDRIYFPGGTLEA